jgi:hypothetical protein
MTRKFIPAALLAVVVTACSTAHSAQPAPAVTKTVTAPAATPTPTDSTPTDSTPTESTPAESTPAESTPADTAPAAPSGPAYQTSCKLVPSNPSWGPSWAGTDMPQLTVVNTGDTTVTVVYLEMNYLNADGTVIGSDGPAPWSPTVSDIPPGATAQLTPSMAGFTPPSGATGCELDPAGSDIR